MVNSNFYSTVNDLMTLASGGTITGVVDYNSFIEAGTAVTSLTDPDKFKNAFLSAFANKVLLSLNTARSLPDELGRLTRGTVSPNGIIEIITNGFLSARTPLFVPLTDGNSVDQYTVQRPNVKVSYFCDDNAIQFYHTIQEIELEGAFKSPEAMQRFLSGAALYLINSYKRARNESRKALVADLIVKNSTATAATTTYDSAQRYPLLTLYNAITGITLTADNCLFNEQFVRYAASVIRMVPEKMSKVSKSFNANAFETFTPNTDSERDIFVNTAFAAALDAYVRPYPGNTQFALIPEGYEEVTNWQSEASPLTVTYDTGVENADPATTAPCIAVVSDRYAIGEYLCKENTRVTPYNAAGEYYNVFINAQTKLIRVDDANSVIFTLE